MLTVQVDGGPGTPGYDETAAAGFNKPTQSQGGAPPVESLEEFAVQISDEEFPELESEGKHVPG